MDRSQNMGPNYWNFFFETLERPFMYTHVGAVWVDYVLIFVLICALVCIGPEMAEKSEFTK